MAIDLRRQGNVIGLLVGRDPSDAAAEALANGKLPSAFRRYRAAVRHAVVRGDTTGELNAHRHLADILLRSGESVAAIAHIIRCGSTDQVKKLGIPAYVDLRKEVLEGAHWERATALSILATESDLVPDDHVSDYLAVALAATSEPHRSVFAPHVSLMAWKAIASLGDRLPYADATNVLTLLDGFIDRKPNHHRHTDDDHVAVVARICDSHPSLAPRAAEHLTQMVLQDFNLGMTVRREVRRSITDPSLLLDALRPHATTHEAAARILDDHGERSEESLEKVAQRIEVVLDAPPPKPGHFSFGTDLPNLAQAARGLDDETRDRLVEHCMSLAEDESRPSSNRSEGMEGVLLLARSVGRATRAALLDRTLPLARLDLPPTAVDLSLSVSHPLSSFRVDLDNGALPRFALQAAALLASSAEEAQAVQDRAVTWLSGDEHATNAVAHALNMLDPTHITIDLAVLAAHPSHSLRQVSAVLAAGSIPPATDVLRALSADGDRRVRRTVADLLPRIADSDKKLATELRKGLRADPSWMVRKAASPALPA